MTEHTYVIRKPLDEEKNGRREAEAFIVEAEEYQHEMDADGRRDDWRTRKEGRVQAEIVEEHRRARKQPQRTGKSGKASYVPRGTWLFQVWDRLCCLFATLVWKVRRVRGGGVGNTEYHT
ncbi:hypothetical protein NDU88_003899 [Pleurodeles waltl]|uniref:Uncharacterized protein n=1 Tax=Pleurodeles waltl TaxID=8319 RepID=A0AAV7MZX7_PLEWA|nr:hypothetical protein NDU88_003899 [Pleurodeles waltl]